MPWGSYWKSDKITEREAGSLSQQAGQSQSESNGALHDFSKSQCCGTSGERLGTRTLIGGDRNARDQCFARQRTARDTTLYLGGDEGEKTSKKASNLTP